MAKNEKLKKLDAEETKGVSGGALYVFKRKSGDYGYYVPGCQYPFFSRDIALSCCKGTLAVDIFCTSEEEAKSKAEKEWARLQRRQQTNVADTSEFEDGAYTINTFITGSLPDSWV